MIDLPQYHQEIYYVSQLSSITIPYGYDHKKVIGNKEVLFYVNCKDGVMILYVEVDCIYVSYEY